MNKILVILVLITTLFTPSLPPKFRAKNRHFHRHRHCHKWHCHYKKPPIDIQIAQQEFVDIETKGAN